MKTNFVLSLVSVVLASTLTVQAHGQTLTNEALSSDRIAIYHEFFTSDVVLASASDSSTLNVSSVTQPFVYKHFVDPDRACLSSAHIFEIATPHLHKLPAETFSSDHINLVDLYNRQPSRKSLIEAPVLFGRASFDIVPSDRPDSIISLSEIVFDVSHTHAAFRYVYATGPDTGRGATAVYVLTDNTWKPAPATCSEWTR